jgi:hypothetical protein
MGQLAKLVVTKSPSNSSGDWLQLLHLLSSLSALQIQALSVSHLDSETHS